MTKLGSVFQEGVMYCNDDIGVLTGILSVGAEDEGLVLCVYMCVCTMYTVHMYVWSINHCSITVLVCVCVC